MNRALICVTLACLLSASSFAHTHKKHTAPRDPSYSSALAAANRFLQAWQTEDHETGIVMLSDSARQNVSNDQLQSFFSPGPDAAYEITHGTKKTGGTYIFPVVLFEGASQKPRTSTLVVCRNGKHDWAIDKLP